QFLGLFDSLAFLADYELIVPLEEKRGEPGVIAAKIVCMGDQRDFVACDCHVEIPDNLRPDVILQESPLLLEPAGRRALMVLYPLCLFDVEPRDELYNYLQSFWRSDYPYALTFGPNQPEVAPLQIRRGEDAARDHVL